MNERHLPYLQTREVYGNVTKIPPYLIPEREQKCARAVRRPPQSPCAVEALCTFRRKKQKLTPTSVKR